MDRLQQTTEKREAMLEQISRSVNIDELGKTLITIYGEICMLNDTMAMLYDSQNKEEKDDRDHPEGNEGNSEV